MVRQQKKVKSSKKIKKPKSHHDSEDEESEDGPEPVLHDISDDDNDWETYRKKEMEKINKSAQDEEEIPFLAKLKPIIKQIDSFVVVQYENKYYPGVIEHLDKDGAYVSAMMKSLNN